MTYENYLKEKTVENIIKVVGEEYRFYIIPAIDEIFEKRAWLVQPEISVSNITDIVSSLRETYAWINDKLQKVERDQLLHIDVSRPIFTVFGCYIDVVLPLVKEYED